MIKQKNNPYNNLWVMLVFIVVMIIVSFFLYFKKSWSIESIVLVDLGILFFLSCGQEKDGESCDANPE